LDLQLDSSPTTGSVPRRSYLLQSADTDPARPHDCPTKAGGKGKGGQGGSYVEGAQQLEETASSGGRSAAAEQLAAQVEGMTLKEEPSPPDHQQLSESKQR
jgi:hypothetical protein